jgi:uncharacterized protein
MELNQDTGEGQYVIRGYGTDFIQINDEKITHSLIVTADKLMTWSPQSFSELKTEHFLTIFELQPSIVLLGTGPRLFFPNPALLADFYTKKIGIEIMDTAAACRTYAILMAEGRNVAAALLIH